jgi:hypothetical protein
VASYEMNLIRLKYDSCLRGAYDSLAEDAAKVVVIGDLTIPIPDRPYCLSFLDALDYFRAALPENTPIHDIANRVGELKSRVDILRHIHTTRVLPSIPDAGFPGDPPPFTPVQ